MVKLGRDNDSSLHAGLRAASGNESALRRGQGSLKSGWDSNMVTTLLPHTFSL